MNAPLAISNKCSSAVSEVKISPSSGATAASGATVVSGGGISFFWLLVLLVARGGIALLAEDTILALEGENVELDVVFVGDAATGEAEGIESL